MGTHTSVDNIGESARGLGAGGEDYFREPVVKSESKYKMKIDKKLYDEEISEELNNLRAEYIVNNGEYDFSIKTRDNEIVHVFPSLKKFNNPEKIVLVFEKDKSKAKSKIEELLKK